MNMKELLKQAQDMQERMQRELAETRVHASVGGGMVKVEMNGHKKLVAVHLDPEIVDRDDIPILADLILAAVNEAGRKVDDKLRSSFGSHAASMPGLF